MLPHLHFIHTINQFPQFVQNATAGTAGWGERGRGLSFLRLPESRLALWRERKGEKKEKEDYRAARKQKQEEKIELNTCVRCEVLQGGYVYDKDLAAWSLAARADGRCPATVPRGLEGVTTGPFPCLFHVARGSSPVPTRCRGNHSSCEEAPCTTERDEVASLLPLAPAESPAVSPGHEVCCTCPGVFDRQRGLVGIRRAFIFIYIASEKPIFLCWKHLCRSLEMSGLSPELSGTELGGACRLLLESQAETPPPRGPRPPRAAGVPGAPQGTRMAVTASGAQKATQCTQHPRGADPASVRGVGGRAGGLRDGSRLRRGIRGLGPARGLEPGAGHGERVPLVKTGPPRAVCTCPDEPHASAQRFGP